LTTISNKRQKVYFKLDDIIDANNNEDARVLGRERGSVANYINSFFVVYLVTTFNGSNFQLRLGEIQTSFSKSLCKLCVRSTSTNFVEVVRKDEARFLRKKFTIVALI